MYGQYLFEEIQWTGKGHTLEWFQLWNSTVKGFNMNQEYDNRIMIHPTALTT